VLKDFDAQTTLNALAIAGSHSAGLIEYTKTGGSVKRIHSAIPTQAGVRGALFAKPDWREPGQRHTSRFDRRSDALR
jgi:2-methylcitrate dehydratase PrpD